MMLNRLSSLFRPADPAQLLEQELAKFEVQVQGAARDNQVTILARGVDRCASAGEHLRVHVLRMRNRRVPGARLHRRRCRLAAA
jgi:hypothetical protein